MNEKYAKAVCEPVGKNSDLEPIVQDYFDLKHKINELQWEMKATHDKLLEKIIAERRFDLLQINYRAILKEVR